MQTQIIDLERFVSYLQQECASLAPVDYNFDFLLIGTSSTLKNQNVLNNDANLSPTPGSPLYKNSIASTTAVLNGNNDGICALQSTYRNNFNRRSDMEHSSFLLKWIGCGSRKFEKNELKKTSFCNHYGYFI